MDIFHLWIGWRPHVLEPGRATIHPANSATTNRSTNPPTILRRITDFNVNSGHKQLGIACLAGLTWNDRWEGKRRGKNIEKKTREAKKNSISVNLGSAVYLLLLVVVVGISLDFDLLSPLAFSFAFLVSPRAPDGLDWTGLNGCASRLLQPLFPK